MKTKELAFAKIRKVRAPAFEHINRQIPPEPHTAMYVWHKYWSRKTWNVVGEHIQAYTREQQVVFDPFAGSGVVAIEAARHKRRAIVCDLNPVASRITELTLHPVKTVKLHEAFERVRERVQKRITDLYIIHCVKCAKPLVADCFVREGDQLVEVRYKGCPHRWEIQRRRTTIPTSVRRAGRSTAIGQRLNSWSKRVGQIRERGGRPSGSHQRQERIQ